MNSFSHLVAGAIVPLLPFAGGALSAQTTASDTAETRVRVTLVSQIDHHSGAARDHEITGVLRGATREFVLIEADTGGGSVQIPMDRVERVEIGRWTRHTKTGAAVGAPVGMLAGVAIGVLSAGECGDGGGGAGSLDFSGLCELGNFTDYVVGGLVGLLIGTGVGAAVGSAIRSEEWRSVDSRVLPDFVVGSRIGGSTGWSVALRFRL